MDIVRVWEEGVEVIKGGSFLCKSESRSSIEEGAEEDAGGFGLPELNTSAIEDLSVFILSLSSLA